MIGNFFSELKRRNVYKVAVAYAVVGWLLIQIATQVFPFFQIPDWGVRLVVLAIVIIGVIGFITICSQTIKAAMSNPVKSLRTE